MKFAEPLCHFNNCSAIRNQKINCRRWSYTAALSWRSGAQNWIREVLLRADNNSFCCSGGHDYRRSRFKSCPMIVFTFLLAEWASRLTAFAIRLEIVIRRENRCFLICIGVRSKSAKANASLTLSSFRVEIAGVGKSVSKLLSSDRELSVSATPANASDAMFWIRLRSKLMAVSESRPCKQDTTTNEETWDFLVRNNLHQRLYHFQPSCIITMDNQVGQNKEIYAKSSPIYVISGWINSSLHDLLWRNCQIKGAIGHDLDAFCVPSRFLMGAAILFIHAGIRMNACVITDFHHISFCGSSFRGRFIVDSTNGKSRAAFAAAS